MTSLSNISDEHLVQQIVQGDLLAFDSLYDRHIRTVYKRVRFAVPDTDIDDVIQEVFLGVIVSLPAFRGEAQFTTWLRALTNNKVSEYHRRRFRKKETMQVDLDHIEENGDGNHNASLEDQVTLQIAFNNLPYHYREIILLRLAEELQFSEIAELLNKNLESTKSLYRRAIAALRENVEGIDEEKLEQSR